MKHPFCNNYCSKTEQHCNRSSNEMDIEQLVSSFKDRNIHIRLANNTKLDIKAPKGIISKEDIKLIKDNKAALTKYFEQLSSATNKIETYTGDLLSFPLAYAQQKIWFLSQVEERSLAYTISDVITIRQQVNIEALEKAIRAVINRHEALRTIFKKDDSGEIRQWVIPQKDIMYKLHNFDVRNEKDSKTYIEKFIDTDGTKAFKLDRDLLVRTYLFQTDDELFKFYFIKHHIVSDGVSMEVMMRDILEFYRAFQINGIANLPLLRIQYKEYALWQKEQLEGEAFNSHKLFWMNLLKGKLPTLDLPNQNPRPKVKTYNGCTLSTFVSKESTASLKEICLENRATVFMGVLTVWNILFYKYTNATDIIIASPVAGRDHADLENLIGVFMNMVIHRNTVVSSKTFNEMLAQVKASAIAATKHQMYPVDKLMDDLDVKFDTSRNPLYDVMLSFHNAGENVATDMVLDSNEVDTIRVENYEKSKLDMLINFKELGGYLYFDINFNTDIYSSEVIKVLMKDFKTILTLLLNNTQVQISKIDYRASLKSNLKKANKSKFQTHFK